MGRTGTLTPIAIFETIEIDGTLVERASLHNISIMDELSGGFQRIGDTVYIYRANQIIPQVENWEHCGDYDPKKHLSVPKKCPYCGEDTIIKKENDSKFLYCSNNDCEGKLINKLDHFCSRTKGLDIRGLSKATLEKLIDWNWVENIEDIYNLNQYKEEWSKKPGFGVRSVNNILNAIESSKKCKLETFLSAIGIPLIGTNNAKEICKHIKTYQEFKDLVNNKFSFSDWDTFGIEKEKSLLKFDYTLADILVANYLEIEPIEEIIVNNNNNNLQNIRICITGTLNQYKNRAALQKDIENAGGKVVSSMSKNVNYLINNNKESTSAKNRSAKQFNIPILSEEEFVEKFLRT
jgi:DNA ligase (NAD+)